MKEITIIGNLGANATQRMTSDGKPIMSFNVAVNQSNGQPVWFNCVGNLRERLLPFLIKGQCVCVVGDLRPSVYNGGLDLTISIDKCELCGSAPAQNSQQQPTQETQSFDADQQVQL